MSELQERVSRIPGVVALVLFGSVARGDSDEHSDYDLLVVFEDKTALWRGWDSVFAETGPMNLNIHAIPETMQELRDANPVFLNELEKHGKVLFARSPFPVTLGNLRRSPFTIVSYDLSKLSYKEKMRVLYHLYGKGGDGTVERCGGFKLSSGSFMVPREEGSELISFIESRGARVFGTDVLLEQHGRTIHEVRRKA